MDSSQKSGFVEEDSAEFLLSNSKYHDCYLTVGDPETDDVEKIGVTTLYLISHSPVFRDMLVDSKLADPSGSNTHIKDVSPATFKLMLRHVYGGKLPNITHEEAADLALCADKYNLQRLVRKAAKRLKPTSAEDVFPALMCASYINCPELELQVTKIIQEETEKIVEDPKFLELDENCILFLVKQIILNICELELWISLVRWAENQVQKNSEKTLRGYLHKVLPYIRLLSLNLEEITEHVLPTNILTSDEFVDLTLAVTKKQTIQSPGLCSFQEKRLIHKNLKGTDFVYEVSYFNKECVFSPNQNRSMFEGECRKYSTMSISTCKIALIDTFTFKSLKIPIKNDNSFVPFDISCSITIYTSSKGLVTSVDSIVINGTAIPNDTVTFPVKKTNGQCLILEPRKMYTLKIVTEPSLPVHTLISNGGDCTTQSVHGCGIIVKFNDPFHIVGIRYRVRE